MEEHNAKMYGVSHFLSSSVAQDRWNILYLALLFLSIELAFHDLMVCSGHDSLIGLVGFGVFLVVSCCHQPTISIYSG